MRQKEYNDLLSKIKCSDDFRKRMQEKLSAEPVDTSDYEDIVSGTEVITAKHRRNKFAAMAAAVVLICGVAGGGAYRFANISDKDNNITNDEQEKDSIYSRLKAQKDKFIGDIVLKTNNEIKYASKCDDLGIFFDFMDNIDTDNEIEKGDFYEDEESITINFYDKENEKKLEEALKNIESEENAQEISLYDEACFTFTFYNNGCFSMTENDNGVTRTTYHCLSYDEMLFGDFPRKMISEEALENLNAVSRDEIEELLDSGFANRDDNRAFFYPADQNYNIEYSVKNKAEFKDELLKFEWERADGYPIGTTDYWLLGFMISNDGYMKRLDGKNFKIYKLKNMSDLESFRNVLKNQLEVADSLDPLKLKAALQKYENEKTSQWVEGPDPQDKYCYDTVSRYYDVRDAKRFIDEITSLDWGMSSKDEIESNTGYKGNDGYYISNGCYEFGFLDNYYGAVSIYLNGYMSVEDVGCYKLENESDIEKLTQICDKYFEMTESSKLAEKIHNGVTGFTNLRAKFTYEISKDTSARDINESISGYITVLGKAENMYLAGEGKLACYDEPKIVEVMMYGHDRSAFRITDKETGTINSAGTYSYDSGYESPSLDYNYFYICKMIEDMLAPRYYSKNDYHIKSREMDGNTELIVHQTDSTLDYEDVYYITLSPDGQLLSYEADYNNGYKKSFKLEDPVFDSPDVYLEDPGTIFDSMEADAKLLS